MAIDVNKYKQAYIDEVNRKKMVRLEVEKKWEQERKEKEERERQKMGRIVDKINENFNDANERINSIEFENWVQQTFDDEIKTIKDVGHVIFKFVGVFNGPYNGNDAYFDFGLLYNNKDNGFFKASQTKFNIDVEESELKDIINKNVYPMWMNIVNAIQKRFEELNLVCKNYVTCYDGDYPYGGFVKQFNFLVSFDN